MSSTVGSTSSSIAIMYLRCQATKRIIIPLETPLNKQNPKQNTITEINITKKGENSGHYIMHAISIPLVVPQV